MLFNWSFFAITFCLKECFTWSMRIAFPFRISHIIWNIHTGNRKALPAWPDFFLVPNLLFLVIEINEQEFKIDDQNSDNRCLFLEIKAGKKITGSFHTGFLETYWIIRRVFCRFCMKGRLWSEWSAVILLRHLVLPMHIAIWKDCYLMVVLWPLITAPAFVMKSWAKSSSFVKMPWWPTLNLAGWWRGRR